MDNDFDFDFSLFETPDIPVSTPPETHYSYVRNAKKSYAASHDSTVPQPESEPYTGEDKVRKSKKVKTTAPKAAEPSVEQGPSESRRLGLLLLNNRLFVVATVLFVISIFVLLAGISNLYFVERQIYNVNTNIATARSEQVRLSNKLSGLTTVDAIDNYAVNVMGMIKVEAYQQNYVSFSDESEVISTSGGKLKGLAAIFADKLQSSDEKSDDTADNAAVNAVDASAVDENADLSADGDVVAADNSASDGDK